jgi:hypothetical protein
MTGTKVQCACQRTWAYPARAMLLYIDPGAGSLVIQAIIAAVISVPFFFRNAIRNGMRRLRGERAETAAAENPAAESASDQTLD